MVSMEQRLLVMVLTHCEHCYDETEQEPVVLPAQYPNLLVNGAGGIAVGMATSIPPHNLGEVIDGTLALIEDKDVKIKDLMKHIPGPDFPTGGVIIGKDIKNRYVVSQQEYTQTNHNANYFINKECYVGNKILCPRF